MEVHRDQPKKRYSIVDLGMAATQTVARMKYSEKTLEREREDKIWLWLKYDSDAYYNWWFNQIYSLRRLAAQVAKALTTSKDLYN